MARVAKPRPKPKREFIPEQTMAEIEAAVKADKRADGEKA
jgi:hypothetical protein